MPVLTIGPNGAGVAAGGHGTHKRAKRQAIVGLSASAARRQVRFLQSVRGDMLDGLGLAITLTMRDLPEGPEELHAALDAFHQVCRRRLLIRGHWVIELQKRGVPHFHLGLYFAAAEEERAEISRELVNAWVAIAGKWGARVVGQHVERILEGNGWAKYCAKHAGRSVKHSQRQGLPEGWESSGRLWGRWGFWPTNELVMKIDPVTYVRLRRLLRSWRYADARKALTSAERALRGARTAQGIKTASHHVDVARSRLRAVRRHYSDRSKTPEELAVISRSVGMREWVPAEVVQEMVSYLVGTLRDPQRTWKSSGRVDRSCELPDWAWREGRRFRGWGLIVSSEAVEPLWSIEDGLVVQLDPITGEVLGAGVAEVA